jgi:GST-like protein
MTELYFHSTPNSMKVALLLEELQAPYELIPVDILNGDQHLPSFTHINPNAKVPAMMDDDITIFDSHAILIHLGEKHGQFLPTSPAIRAKTLSWLMFIGTGLSPFCGQAVHFLHYAPEVLPYARNRYVREVERHYRVLDTHLANAKYLAGDAYTIADMALWGWGISAAYIFGERGLADYPNVKRLVDDISARPAAAHARARRDNLVAKTEFDDIAKRAMFPQNFS